MFFINLFSAIALSCDFETEARFFLSPLTRTAASMFGATHISDLASGFLFLLRFSQKTLWVFLIFIFSIKILQFSWQREGLLQPTSRQRARFVDPKPEVEDKEENEEEEEEEDEEESGFKTEESDAKTLREMAKNERRKRKKAVAELERERVAAASAAEEAMAMILRLQREKSLIEMEANHDRRMAEHRQQHDDQVIRYLEKIAMDYEKENQGR